MNKTTLTILSSILLSSALLSAATAMARPTGAPPHALEHFRNPLAARLADRFAEPDAARAHKPAGNSAAHKSVLPDLGYTIIDEPDADPGLYGTRVFFINESYQITGQYVDSSGAFHAFLCDFPACSAGKDFTVITVNDSDTFGFMVNDKGEMCGGYVDNDTGVENAWIRNPKNGQIETVIVGTGGTVCQGLNNKGVMAGNYFDDNGATHGFIRAKDGTITLFDDPLGGSGSGQGTNPININDKGVVSGTVFDSGDVAHGFLRFPDGTFKNYDVPGAGSGAYQGTEGYEIEDNGWITGAYVDSNDVLHGFMISPKGKFIEVDAPDGGIGPGQGTLAVEHREAGWGVGEYIDANDVDHGYLREKDGNITEFDPPGAGDIGTYTVISSNRDHVIAGTFKDDNAIRHGFVRKP